MQISKFIFKKKWVSIFSLLVLSSCIENPFGSNGKSDSTIPPDHRPGTGGEILAKIPDLSYENSIGNTGTLGVEMTVTPTIFNENGAALLSCSVKSGTTALPSWATINASDCVISGAPTFALPETSYTIVASNSAGTSEDALVQLSVTAASPTWLDSFSLASSTSISTTLAPMASYTANATDETALGGMVYQYSVGTVSGGTDLVNWTAASGTSFQVSDLSLSIGVNYYMNMRAVDAMSNASSVHTESWQVISLPTLSYGGGLTATRGAAMSITPSVLSAGTAATISNCLISAGGALPMGISISSSTCIISGTPTSLLGGTVFSITATNSFSQTTTSTVALGVSEDFSDSDNSSSSGFARGTHTGTSFDSTNSFLRLSQSGTPTNNSELDQSWTPQWNRLKSYWQFNNSWTPTVGPATFSAGNGATFSTPAKMGTHAADFDGNNDYASTSVDLDLDAEGQYTVSLWMNPEEYEGDWIFALLGEIGYLEIYSQSGTYFCVVQDDGDYTNCFSLPKLNQWYHVVISYSSIGYIRIYLNGNEVANEAPGLSLYPGPSSITLGRTNSGGNNSDIKIDDLAIWNVQLSADEIRSVYSRQSPKYSGTFLSRVYDAQGSNAWDGFKWLTTLPFGKELPGDANNSNTISAADSESSTSYSSLVGSTGATTDNNLMNSLVAMYHMNSSEDDITKISSSLQGNASFTSHRVLGNYALNLDGNGDYMTQNYSAGANVGVVPSVPFSMSAWIYINAWPTSNTGGIFGKNGSDTHYSLSLANKRLSLQTSSGSPYNSNLLDESHLLRWVHVALVVKANNELTFYVDGAAHGSATFSTTFDYSDTEFAFGVMFSEGGNAINYFNGSIDEVAVWTRALHVNEVHQIYRRGANRIQFQTRACTTADCSDNPSWLGSNGSNAPSSYFSELQNNTSFGASGLPTGRILVGFPELLFSWFSNLSTPNNQYFQYRAILDSSDLSTGCDYGGGPTWCAPELKSVTITP